MKSKSDGSKFCFVLKAQKLTQNLLNEAREKQIYVLLHRLFIGNGRKNGVSEPMALISTTLTELQSLIAIMV